MKSSDFKELIVWQKSMRLCEYIYNITKSFPTAELFSLTNQLKRCAVSIPSNIAEGQARHSDKAFIQFLNISYGSLAELETQLIISKVNGYIEDKAFHEICDLMKEIGRMIISLINSLEK